MTLEAMFKGIVDRLPSEVIFTDTDFCVRYLNSAAEKTLDLNCRDAEGQPLTSFLSEDNPVGLLETISARALSAGWQGKLNLKGDSGARIRMHVVAVGSENDKIVHGFCFVGIGHVQNSYFERKKSSGSDSREQPQMNMSEASEIVRELTHSINNPLVGVFNFSQLLLEKLSPEHELYELAETIQAAAKECKDIITEWRKQYYCEKKS